MTDDLTHIDGDGNPTYPGHRERTDERQERDVFDPDAEGYRLMAQERAWDYPASGPEERLDDALRFINYLWTATGTDPNVHVCDLFGPNDPIHEDIERFGGAFRALSEARHDTTEDAIDRQ